MSQRRIVYQWFGHVAQRMGCLTKPQAWNLAAWSLGLALSRRCTLRMIAEALWSLGRADSLERRLQRFLGKQALPWREGSRALAAWVIGCLGSREPLVVLIDETSLRDRLKVMAISLAYRGRAIPLAWSCYHQERWPTGQVRLILRLLDRIAPAFPPGARVLIQADRGIGNSPALLRAIEERGWYFLVRVARHVRVRLADGREEALGHLVTQRGGRWQGRVVAFKNAGWLPCWGIAQWDGGWAEPWLLLTNYPQAQGHWYALRMWEEAAFKDFKSNGWQWQRSRVWDPEHANRLWLIMALAYLWMILLGTQVAQCPALRARLSRGRHLRHSVFQLGLRYLHQFHHGVPKPWYRLVHGLRPLLL